MANLRSNAGGTSKRNLIVDFYNKNAVKDDKGQVKGYYVDAQLDQSLMKPDTVKEGKGGKSGVQLPDSNPHLNSRERKSLDGKSTYVDHRFFVSKTALDKMYKASEGKNFIENKGTEDQRIVMGINADLFINKDKEVVINTAKEMGPTTNPQFGKTVLDKQEAVTKAKKEYNANSIKNRAKEASAEKEIQEEVSKEAPEADLPF